MNLANVRIHMIDLISIILTHDTNGVGETSSRETIEQSTDSQMSMEEMVSVGRLQGSGSQIPWFLFYIY